MRKCFNCQSDIPAETTHFILDDEAYCESCVDEHPYTGYSYYVNGDCFGSSEEDCRKVNDYEDDYEEEAS